MKNILLVEDDPFLIDVYSIKLEKEDFSLEVAKDGEEAVQKLKEGNFDLVVLDIVLPHTDGWAILEQIRENPLWGDLKIVVLSNLGQRKDVEKGIKLGAAKYLIKAHFTPSQVVEEIKKLLE